MREPSRGGIGIRLKTPNMTFMIIKFSNIKFKGKDKRVNLNIMLKINAKIKFARGPLNPIKRISLLGFFREE